MEMFISVLLLCLINLACCLQFSNHPIGDKIQEGYDVELACILTGDLSQVQLSWEKDSAKITEGEELLDTSGLAKERISVDIIRTGVYVYTLFISRVVYEDSGSYSCVVFQNGEQVLESDYAVVTVFQLPSPEYPICTRMSRPVITEEEITFKCEGEAINPPIDLSWSIIGSKLAINDKSYVDSERTFATYSLTASPNNNNAVYVCSLTTPANRSIVRSCSIGPLNVWYKPNITMQHAGRSFSGREAIFICQSDANPPVVDFTWQFDPPLNIERYVIDDIGQVMRILRVTLDENGLLVKCIAKNTVGQVTSHVIMEVIGNKENDKPKTNAIESVNEKQPEKKSISLSVLLAVVSVLVLVIVFAIIVPVYYFCICSKKEETVVIAQPEVYFEPQDRLTLPLPNKRNSVLWRRSFGAQVPTDRDIDAMYLEIQSDHYIFTPDSRGNTLPY
ncbi:uncharacterized protein [Antedon mediterranea]|uniref:uncharacterized protein n=1 Tax=Antedon mediterranea TaxID=105859 RepID=UPI003AF6F03A